jgi:hypothetical protein
MKTTRAILLPGAVTPAEVAYGALVTELGDDVDARYNAFIRAFEAADMDLDALRAFDRPVWFALGGLSNPDLYAPMRDRLATVFPDFSAEAYAERHHFDPPHRAEPARVAAALRAHWARADAPA